MWKRTRSKWSRRGNRNVAKAQPVGVIEAVEKLPDEAAESAPAGATSLGLLGIALSTNQDELLIGSIIALVVKVTNTLNTPLTVQKVIPILPAKFKNLTEGTEKPITLSPGSSALVAFKIQHPRQHYSPVSTFQIHAQVLYDVQGKSHRNVGSMELTLRPKRWSLAIGALLGATFGVTLSVLRNGDVVTIQQQGVDFSKTLLVSALLSVVAVWILATMIILGFNKSKYLITVEDLIGAAVVAFAVVFGTVELAGISNEIIGGLTGNATPFPDPTPAPTVVPTP